MEDGANSTFKRSDVSKQLAISTPKRSDVSKRLARTALERIRLVQRPPSSDLAALYARGKLCSRHREAVVEFVADLSEDLDLQVQTAGLAIHLFDRYTARAWRTSPESKLIACVTVTLAAKFLETAAPTFAELGKQIGCTQEVMLAAELDVLGVLGWDIHIATPHVVAEQLFVVVDASPACRLRTEFYIDLSFYEHKMLAHSAMCIACAALMLSWVYCEDDLSAATHSQLLSRISGVDLSELGRCRATLQSAVNALKSHGTSSGAPASAAQGAAAGRESPDSIMDPFVGEGGEPRAKRHAPAGTFGDNSNFYFKPV